MHASDIWKVIPFYSYGRGKGVTYLLFLIVELHSLLSYGIVFVLVSCSNPKPDLTVLNFEKDLIPEGIAIDSYSKRLYLNSLKKNKIVTSLLDGTDRSVFLETSGYGYLSGFGMVIKGDTLYALGNSLGRDKNRSILLLLQLSTGNLVDSYTLDNNGVCYWNDLTIRNDNEIFITDSESNKIYRIRRPSKTLEVYSDTGEIPNSNGITISENNEYLYLASNKGICIVNVQTKQLINKPEIEFFGIDGLKFHENNLYGIVNIHVRDKTKNGLFKYKLDRSGTKVLKKQKIVEFTEEFDVPTTFDIVDGSIFFIANTQLDNFNEKTNSIVDSHRLQPYKLVKIDLE